MFKPQKKPPFSRSRKPSRRERWLSALLLVVLIIIAVSVFAMQFQYDPALWRDLGTVEIASGSGLESATLSALETPGLQAMSPTEVYDSETLSDKINGKAELYLPAGFVRLECRRFALEADPARWMELFVYDMGDNSGAFSVYSQQRREQAQPLDLTAEAYQSTNGIFLVQGAFYLEIIGSDSSDALVAEMIALARTFVELHPAAEALPDERTLFPKEGLVAESVALTSENAFGFEAFNRIFTAEYRNADHLATAFVSRRASDAEAAELADAYITHLIEYGGRRLESPADGPPITVIEIMDMIEIVFHQGDILAGIHEANDLAFALSLAHELHHSVKRDDHEP